MDTNASGAASRGWHALTRRDWLTFDRADFIATKVFLGVAVVGAVLFGLTGPILGAVNEAPLQMSYTTAVPGGMALPSGTTQDGSATLKLLLTDATLLERLGQALPGLLVAAMTVAIAWLIFQLLRSTQAMEPFTRRNVRRINTIALIIGLGGILWQLATAFADNAIYTTDRLPDLGYLPFEATFSPFPLLAMFVIALIGEAFRRGVVLREDVDGLVQVPVHEPHRIVCHLGDLLDEREMTLTALADAVGVSLVNLSIMKNNRAKAIRYSTLTAICQVLDCQPGELLSIAD